MKVAFVLPGRGVSGGVRVTSIVANGLLERNHEVRILYQGMPLKHRARFMMKRFLGAQDWLSGFRGELGEFQDVRDCRFREHEIIVAVGMSMSYQLGFLASGSNAKVQYIHGATPWDPDLMRKALSLPFPKILVASYLKDVVATSGRGKVLAVAHNGMDPTVYFNSVPDSQCDGVGTIYSGHPAKDPETILAVLKRLSASRPGVPLRVFGGDRRPPESAGLKYDRSPSLERAREIYSQSLVWFLASRSEGFPAPLLESMACGCAVVATDCGGPRDVIVDGVNGFLVPVGDLEAIVRRVGYLLDNPATRRRICAAAQRTTAHFTWEKCVGEIERALGVVLEMNMQGDSPDTGVELLQHSED